MGAQTFSEARPPRPRTVGTEPENQIFSSPQYNLTTFFGKLPNMAKRLALPPYGLRAEFSASISSNSWSRRDLILNSCILSSLPWLFHVYFTLSLPGVDSRVPTSSIEWTPSCVKPISLAIPPRSSTLRICCKTQIISYFAYVPIWLLPSYITSRPQSDWHCPPQLRKELRSQFRCQFASLQL